MNDIREDLSADFAELLASLPEADRGKQIVRLGGDGSRSDWRSRWFRSCGGVGGAQSGRFAPGVGPFGQRRFIAPRVKEPGGRFTTLR